MNEVRDEHLEWMRLKFRNAQHEWQQHVSSCFDCTDPVRKTAKPERQTCPGFLEVFEHFKKAQDDLDACYRSLP